MKKNSSKLYSCRLLFAWSCKGHLYLWYLLQEHCLNYIYRQKFLLFEWMNQKYMWFIFQSVQIISIILSHRGVSIWVQWPRVLPDVEWDVAVCVWGALPRTRMQHRHRNRLHWWSGQWWRYFLTNLFYYSSLKKMWDSIHVYRHLKARRALSLFSDESIENQKGTITVQRLWW